jgi:hypothetical protein
MNKVYAQLMMGIAALLFLTACSENQDSAAEIEENQKTVFVEQPPKAWYGKPITMIRYSHPPMRKRAGHSEPPFTVFL